jgi:hypothetical protein
MQNSSNYYYGTGSSKPLVSRRCSFGWAIFLGFCVSLIVGLLMMFITSFIKGFNGAFFSGWVACMAYINTINYLRQPVNGG